MESEQVRIPHSTLVTVLAWIFIVLGGFATFVSILQNVMIAFIFPLQNINIPAIDPRTGREIPWIVPFLFSHFQLIALSVLVASAGTLVAAIGLLKRKNWARLLFITIMALAIIWNIAGFLLMLSFFSSWSDFLPPANPEFARQFDVTWKIMASVNALFVAAFVWLFAWIIKRLISQAVRHEFSAV